MRSISTSTREDIYSPPNLTISDEVKDLIIRNHIEPSYIDDITKLIKGRKDWKLVGQIFETMSKALVAIGGIVSFAAGSYDNFNLSFVAGAVSTISLATLSFSSFGYKENKKQSLELNNILKKLKLDEVPINERNVEDFQVMSRQSAMNSYTPQLREVNQLRDQEFINEINALREALMRREREIEEIKIKRTEEDTIKINIISDEEKV